MDKTPNDIVNHYSTLITDSHIFFSNSIPQKKLQKATKSYAPSVVAEDALVLFDNTFFGNAKDGALLTSTTLYVRNQTQQPKQIDLEQIEDIALKERKLKSVVLINQIKYIELEMLEKRATILFTQMLRDLVHLMHGEPIEGPGDLEPETDSIQKPEQTGPNEDRFCPNCHKKVPVTGGIGCLGELIGIGLCFVGLVPGIIWFEIFNRPYRCKYCNLKLSRGGAIGTVLD